MRGLLLAEVAELVDALDSGSSRGNPVEVQVLFSAPYTIKPALKRAFLYLISGISERVFQNNGFIPVRAG